MIIHASIPAKSPENTARILSSIIDGAPVPFPPVKGAWVVVPFDGSGHTIEIYPLGAVAIPSPSGVQLLCQEGEKMKSGFHIALGTKKTQNEIIELGKEHRIRTVICERAGIFGVIELWIEDELLIEVLTEAELMRYHDFWKVRTHQIRQQTGK